MNDVFADTSYFLALTNSRDERHLSAVEQTRSRSGRLITTVWVLLELANSLSRGEDRNVFLRLLGMLRSDPSCEILPPDATLFEQGIAHFASRPDKSWSLTDCISFLVMEQADLTAALTSDHHFEQAGFRALLLEQPPQA